MVKLMLTNVKWLCKELELETRQFDFLTSDLKDFHPHQM